MKLIVKRNLRILEIENTKYVISKGFAKWLVKYKNPEVRYEL